MVYNQNKYIGSLHAVDALVHATISYYRHDTPEALSLMQAARALVEYYIAKGFYDKGD